jgi:hypothetical protein
MAMKIPVGGLDEDNYSGIYIPKTRLERAEP